MEFTIENTEALRPGMEVNVTEGVLPSSYYYIRRLRNATNRINTAFFVPENQITPHWIWYNRVVQKL